MGFSMEILLFAIFAVACVVTAVLVVAFRDPVKAAMSLIACFFCIACTFLLQSAELIAILEVLIYAGAIMVLFVFVIMLVENKAEAVVSTSLASRAAVPVKVVAVGMLAYAMIVLIGRSSLPPSAELPSDFGSVSVVGHEFFDNFLFHFELTSLLLLVAIVGAVVVSRKGRA